MRCSVTGRPLVKRYFWVQAENSGGYQWKSDVKDVARQRDQHDVHIPRRSRNVSLEVIDDGLPDHGSPDHGSPGDAGPSKQARDQEYDVYGTDSSAHNNNLDTPMGLNTNDRHSTPMNVITVADYPSESEEEMTYIGWEIVRSGRTKSKPALEVELGTPGPGIGSLDHDMYDDYDGQLLGSQVHDDSDKMKASMPAADHTERKSVSPIVIYSVWPDKPRSLQNPSAGLRMLAFAPPRVVLVHHRST